MDQLLLEGRRDLTSDSASILQTKLQPALLSILTHQRIRPGNVCLLAVVTYPLQALLHSAQDSPVHTMTCSKSG